ncbi:hypothetical protein ACTFIU_009008 [Dictyostelium citrinum]
MDKQIILSHYPSKRIKAHQLIKHPLSNNNDDEFYNDNKEYFDFINEKEEIYIEIPNTENDSQYPKKTITLHDKYTGISILKYLNSKYKSFNLFLIILFLMIIFTTIKSAIHPTKTPSLPTQSSENSQSSSSSESHNLQSSENTNIKTTLNAFWFTQPPSFKTIESQQIRYVALDSVGYDEELYGNSDAITKEIYSCVKINEKHKDLKMIKEFYSNAFSETIIVKIGWYILNINKEFSEQSYFKHFYLFFATSENLGINSVDGQINAKLSKLLYVSLVKTLV